MARRPRACAAPGVGWQKYLAAVTEWGHSEGRKSEEDLADAESEEDLADAAHAGWKLAAATGLSENEILAWGLAVDEGRVVQHMK